MTNSNQKQVIFIHGGEVFKPKEEFYNHLKTTNFDLQRFKKKRWRDWLSYKLKADGYDWIFMEMPCKENADYKAWQLWFERLLPYLKDGVILIGHSLGGSFLLKYLSENILNLEIGQLHLVAPAIEVESNPGLDDFATDLNIWSGFKTEPKALYIYHSIDDPVVPFEDSQKFKQIYSKANLYKFNDRHHFIGEDLPELYQNIT